MGVGEKLEKESTHSLGWGRAAREEFKGAQASLVYTGVCEVKTPKWTSCLDRRKRDLTQFQICAKRVENTPKTCQTP